MEGKRSQSGLGQRLKAAWSLVRGGASAMSVTEFFERVEKGLGSQDRPRHPYRQVIALHAAVKTRADAIARMPLRVSSADDQVIESGPIVQLAERPNPAQSGRAFWRSVEAFLVLFGRVHFVFTLSGGSSGVPVEVYAVNPLQMAAHRDSATGELMFWRYRPAGLASGAEVRLPPHEVHTIIDPDYEDPHVIDEGLGVRHVAALAIAQYYKADIANEASLDNGVEPGGMLSVDGNLTEDQRRELRKEIDDHHSGVRNRRRWLLGEGGMSWEQLGAAFGEMEFSQLKFMSREDICVAVGVNPLVVGFGGRESMGSGQHTEAAIDGFWDGVVLPRANWLAEEWDEAVNRRFQQSRSIRAVKARREGKRRKLHRREHILPTCRQARGRAGRADLRFYAWFDASGIPAVQRSQLRLSESARNWVEKGVTLNETIRAFDLPFEEHWWGETWWRPMGLINVEDEAATSPGSDDPPGPPDPDLPDDPPEPDETPRRVDRSRDPDHIRRLSAADLERLWLRWRESWQGLEQTMRSRVRGHFQRLRRQTLASLEEHLGQRSIDARNKDVIGEVLFDIVAANDGLIARVGPLIRDAHRLGGQQAFDEAAAAEGRDPSEADAFSIELPGVAEAIERREVNVKGANRTLRRRIRDQISQGMDANEPVSEIADRVRREFNYASSRANAIARTEVGGAVEDAKQVGRAEAGIPSKSWLWSRRETGRPWHMETEDQTMAAPVPVQENFTLAQTGARTPYPRGPGLAAEDAVNCGCTTISRYPDDSARDARLIKHLVSRGFTTYAQLEQRRLTHRHQEQGDVQNAA